MSRRRIAILCSYFYLRRSAKMRDALAAILDAGDADILVDSGAFSEYAAHKKALTGGGKGEQPITLQEYMGYCKSVHGKAWGYIQLDKIRDPDETHARLARMRDAGLDPMGVSTEGDPMERAPKLLNSEGRVCVAGGVGGGDRYIWDRYIRFHEATGQRSKIHALGFLRWPDCLKLPIASGDSCACFNGQRFGLMVTFDPRKGFRYLDRTKNAKADHPLMREMIGEARKVGATYEQLKGPATYRTAFSLPSFMTMVSHLKFQHFADGQGFRTFVVCGGNQHLATVAAAAAGWRAKSYARYAERYAELIRASKHAPASFAGAIVDDLKGGFEP